MDPNIKQEKFRSSKDIDKLPTERERRAERQRKIDAYESKFGRTKDVLTERDVDKALEIKSHLPKGASLSPKGDLGALREKEIKAFNPVEYWKIEAQCKGESVKGKGESFVAPLVLAIEN